MILKILLLVGCLVLQGYGKAVEAQDDEPDEPNKISEGVAAIVDVIDEILENADDIKVSQLRDLAGKLIQESSELDTIVDTLILEVSNGVYFGKRIPDIVIRPPKGSPAVRLSKEDKFMAAIFQSLINIKESLVKVAQRYDEAASGRIRMLLLRALKQVVWATRQVGLAALRVAADAKEDVAKVVLQSKRDVDGEEKKIRKRRKWSWKLNGVHWNRGNHHFRIGPTFGRGGFGGGATYTWRFK